MEEKSYRIHIRQGEFELDVEGDRAFVEAYAEAFLAEEGDLESMSAPGQKRRKRPKGRTAHKKTPRAPLGEVSTDKVALKAFMRGKPVKSNKERYLEYMRFWHSQGAKEVGDRHIRACYFAEGLPMPPTGRQNFGSLRGEGLVKGGSQRGLWALTSTALEGPPARVKMGPGPKARGKKAAKGKKRQPAGRKAHKAVKKVAPKANPPAKRRPTMKKAPPRKTAAKIVSKGAPSETATPEGA